MKKPLILLALLFAQLAPAQTLSVNGVPSQTVAALTSLIATINGNGNQAVTSQTGTYATINGVPHQAFATSTAVVAPAISGEPLNSNFTATANGLTIPIYNASVKQLTNPSVSIGNDTTGAGESTGTSGFGSFSMTGSATVSVTYSSAITGIVVKPAALGISPTISGSTATFNVPQTGPLLVEINGDTVNSLQLFVNPPASPPTPGANVIIYPQGRTDIATLSVTAGQTVYIPDGAIIYSTNTSNTHLFNLFGSGIKIYGYGIVDGSVLPDHQQNSIFAYNAPGFIIDGPVLRDASSFHCFITQTNGGTINNVKVIGKRLNSDGFDIANSQNITITNSYARTFDDLFVVKTTGSTGLADSGITFRNNVGWNAVAHAFSIGNETNMNIDTTLFDSNTVIRDRGRVATFGVYGSNSGVVSNTTFSNNVVEEVQLLVDVRIPSAAGSFTNIAFSNTATPTHLMTAANVYGQTTNISVLGFNSTNNVSGVTFTNMTENGVALTTAGVTKNAYVSGLTVTP